MIQCKAALKIGIEMKLLKVEQIVPSLPHKMSVKPVWPIVETWWCYRTDKRTHSYSPDIKCSF